MSKATHVVVDGVSYPLDDTTAVDFSEAQSLSAAEKQQACTNIGAGSAADVTSIQTAIGTVPSGSNLQGEVADLKSALSLRPDGKNKINCNSAVADTINNVTFTPHFTRGFLDYINVNGTASARTHYNISTTIGAGSYILSSFVNENGQNVSYTNVRTEYFNNSEDFDVIVNSNEEKTGTVSTDMSITFRIDIANGNAVNNVKVYPMMRLSTETERKYVPYGYFDSVQKSLDDIYDVLDDAEPVIYQFDKTYIDGDFVHTTGQFAYNNAGFCTIRSNAHYETFRYNISKPIGIRTVLATVYGDSVALALVCDASNNVLSQYKFFGDTNQHEITNYDIYVSEENASYVIFTNYIDATPNPVFKLIAYKSLYDESQDSRSRWLGKTLVCFGDSRTWYDGNIYNQNTKSEWTGKTCVGYQQTISKLLGCNIINQGVSGETSPEICTRIRQYDFSSADAVLLEGGVNDYIVSPNPTTGELQPIGSTFDTTTVYGAWQSAIEYLMNNYPSVKIYIDTPCIAWNQSADTVMPYSFAEVKKNIAELYNLPCKDMYKEAGITVINRDYFYVDNVETTHWRLHFNDYGNAWIGAILAEFIKTN